MANAYESSLQKVIPAVLLYAFYGDEVLLIKKKDHWNGLGGKLELGESPREAAVREFTEESGLITETESWRWLGQLTFPHFNELKNEDWWVTVFVTRLSDAQRSQVQTHNEEGTLHWVPRGEVIHKKLWEGDRYFLPYLLNERPFEGTLYYRNGKCIRTDINLIE